MKALSVRRTLTKVPISRRSAIRSTVSVVLARPTQSPSLVPRRRQPKLVKGRPVILVKAAGAGPADVSGKIILPLDPFDAVPGEILAGEFYTRVFDFAPLLLRPGEMDVEAERLRNGSVGKRLSGAAGCASQSP